MLESGMPLLEAVETVRHSVRAKRSALRSVLAALGESLRSGSSLSEAMSLHASWFDPVETAMVRAGQLAGDLTPVLRRLADRHQRSDALAQKLTSCLVYPMIVTVVGVGVVIFLGTKTLPDLVEILSDAGITTPSLTAAVLALGRLLAAYWWLIGSLLLILPFLPALVGRVARACGVSSAYLEGITDRLIPTTVRRIAIAAFALRLAERTRAGIPIVEALRIVAPTTQRSLRTALMAAAESIECGDDLAESLSDDRWFDAEFRQLLAIGQASGELDDLLERIASRYERQARRLIDRLAALLEPAVILILAFLIGIVVMAAILPLVRLQEVI